jgi:hypothetical protein
MRYVICLCLWLCVSWFSPYSTVPPSHQLSYPLSLPILSQSLDPPSLSLHLSLPPSPSPSLFLFPCISGGFREWKRRHRVSEPSSAADSGSRRVSTLERTVLHYTVLHCTVNCTVSYSVVLYNAVLYYTALYCTELYYIALFFTVISPSLFIPATNIHSTHSLSHT